MVASAAGVIVIALAVAVVVGRNSSSGEPQLDAAAARGKQVATAKGCLSCHSTTGNRSEGPTWKGLYGSSKQLTAGTTVAADDVYLTRAIKEPRSEVVAGYRAGMPVVPVTDDELLALIAYIKALA